MAEISDNLKRFLRFSNCDFKNLTNLADIHSRRSLERKRIYAILRQRDGGPDGCSLAYRKHAFAIRNRLRQSPVYAVVVHAAFIGTVVNPCELSGVSTFTHY